jgi:hypothetical protein
MQRQRKKKLRDQNEKKIERKHDGTLLQSIIFLFVLVNNENATPLSFTS